jgi:hypothetical protein
MGGEANRDNTLFGQISILHETSPMSSWWGVQQYECYLSEHLKFVEKVKEKCSAHEKLPYLKILATNSWK